MPRTGRAGLGGLIVAVAALAGCTLRHDVGGEIVITDESTGCFHSAHSSTRYVWNGASYVGDGRSVSSTRLCAVRDALINSRVDRDAALDQLGITPHNVAANRTAMLDAAGQMWPDAIPTPMPVEWQRAFSFEEVRREICGTLLAPPESTTRVRFHVSLPGEPAVEAESHSGCPYMLPWTVRCGDDQWQSYSPEIPRALALLAAPEGPNECNLEGGLYWRRYLWSDSSVWGMHVVHLLESAPTISPEGMPNVPVQQPDEAPGPKR